MIGNIRSYVDCLIDDRHALCVQSKFVINSTGMIKDKG